MKRGCFFFDPYVNYIKTKGSRGKLSGPDNQGARYYQGNIGIT